MKAWSMTSPNKLLSFFFTLKEKQGVHGIPVYSVTYKNRPLLLDSRLGLQLDGDPSLLDGFTVTDVHRDSYAEEWRPLYGERDVIPDRYSRLAIHLQEKDGNRRQLRLEFRLYDEGLAFRYHVPEQETLSRFTISGEHSQFHVPEGSWAYEEHGAEGEYAKVSVRDLKPNCERPLTVVYPDGTYIAITEAALDNYSRTLFSVHPASPWIIESTLSGLLTGFEGYGLMSENLPEEKNQASVIAQAPFSSPWRVVLVGDRPGDLLEHNYLVLNLNEPCALEDTSWIVPGKLIREMTLSQEGGRACVDFAAERGLQYVMLDWGWYGDPFDDRSDCTRPVNEVWFYNKKEGERTHTLDVQELVQYGAAKGIAILLYLDRRAVEHQIDRFLPVFKEWGIKGLKFGFVNTGPQYWTQWLHECIRKCAEYQLLVNVHDAYRTTGFTRTYPNMLTVEGIRGNEHMPTARHNATLPFTRFLAGCGDYTICYYSDRIQTTHAHQLAMSVIAYSPLHSIYWYDQPADAQGEPETEFFDRLPTVWDETRVLTGQIGEYAAIARRKGEEWFIGTITNELARDLDLPLDFLKQGKAYLATTYNDDLLNKASRTGVSMRITEVNASSRLQAYMAPSGGQAIWIRPKARDLA
ncbi:glycoside hydrolase family 97 protein [Paenibacillus rigui]|nr:glycoside hydrolase family 97 protein [Paenibacillus rigui]